LNGELNNQFAGKAIRLRIVDEKSNGWGHINADDFLFKDNLNDFLSFQKDAFGLLADKDKPVWGFADTHAHWVNHNGLKGLMHGTPGGNLETSNVLTDIPPCDGFNHGLPSITPGILLAQLEPQAFRRAGERMADVGNLTCAAMVFPSGIAAFPVSGIAAGFGAMDVALGNFLIAAMFNPAFQACVYQFTKDVFAKHYNNSIPNTTFGNFVDYPRWNTQFHQQMHISWVKRSCDGGQRLMVVQVGVAKSWEFLTTADGNMGSAKKHIEDAVTEIKEIVSLNPGWLQIAYTPKQAREIILSNKMAIVLGIEQAEIGNYFETDDEEISWLKNLGITYAYPVHNLNNKIGGAAVFNTALNSYNDLVNRTTQNDTLHIFKIKDVARDADERDNTYTNFTLDRMFMRQAIRNIPLAGFGDIPFFHLNDVPENYQYQSLYFSGHKNAEGLSRKGRNYIDKLMKNGFVLDIDHMSDLTRDEVMWMGKNNNYPIISGHTNFRSLRSNGLNGTTAAERKRTEFTIHDNCLYDIITTGGMFGLMTQQNDVVQHEKDCPWPNNAAGGSSSFAQSYWYLYKKTSGLKGIAFGTDCNGYAPQIAPRFGVDVAAVIEGDELRNFQNVRRREAFVQKNGVKYDSLINTYHYHRFLKPSFLTSEEREIWEALAMSKSGVNINTAWQPGGGISVERTWLQQNKIKNLVTGFKLSVEQYNELDCPDYGIGKGDCPAERKAAYMCVHGDASVQQNWKDERTMELYRIVKQIYELWMQFENGPNEPMRRSYAYPGGRDFDFNLDGLAHYGMLPDLIQDLKNQGLNPTQLRPLFLGTEEYIKMWEKQIPLKIQLETKFLQKTTTMKKLLILSLALAFFACKSNKKNENPAVDIPQQTGTTITIDGNEMKMGGSLLVNKDKKKLQPGADYFCMLTASGGSNNESLILNFLLDTKPGTYPVVGRSFQRGPSDKGELYGGIMGGEEKIYESKVTLTECIDLGSNNMGGHKWSISGTFENIVIPAMGVMLMDKSKNHPKDITIQKGSFSNLTFDDNAEELLEKALEQMKKK